MKKIHPHGINSILSLIFGIIFIMLSIPGLLFIVNEETFNTIYLVLFFIDIIIRVLFVSEFLGDKIIITEDTIEVFKWYKSFCFIDLNQITDANLGHFCKEWWSHGDTVLSVKVYTKEEYFAFPIASYSRKQRQILKDTLESRKKIF